MSDLLYTSASVTITGAGAGATASVEAALGTLKRGRLIAHRTRVTAGNGLATYVFNQASGEGDAVNNQGIIDPVLTVTDANEPITHDPPVPFSGALYVSVDNDGGVGEAGTILFEVWYERVGVL